MISPGLDVSDAQRVIATALDEDLTYGPDYTTLAVVGESDISHARVVSRQYGVLAGAQLIEMTLAAVGAHNFHVTLRATDGDRLQPGDVIAEIEAPTRDLLTAERTLLNLVTHLSGIASQTAAWVDAVAGTGAQIRCSRKTLPGLRLLQKYAVRAGGGINHRMGLGDRAMIKDNHVVAAGSVAGALRRVREAYPDLWCETEVDTLAQLDDILAEGPQEVLLDNFEVWETQVAVQRRNKLSPETLLESSGGLSLEYAREYATCGVDFLAIGALTHSVTALDLGLDFD